MRYVYDFDEEASGGRELLGGKGIGLAEMTALGVPVPAGFTITTDACRAYMASGGGDFPGAYSFFDDTPNTPTIKWTMPARGAIADDGLLVRFWFVLRDGRGGSSYVQRAICVVPPT